MVVHSYPWHLPCSQDTVLTVPPYSFVLDDPLDVPLEECLFARPQRHFNCYLRPRDGMMPTGRRTYGKDDIQVQLMLYSTFEVLDLLRSGLMETRRVVKLYEPSPTPILYVGSVSNVLRQLPLMPLFIRWNSTPTIQHYFHNLQRSKFP